MEITYIILLGLAVSIDGFFAGIAYGLKGIHIPFKSLATVGAMTLLYTAIACWGSQYIIAALSPEIATCIGAFVLILLGSTSILRHLLKKETNMETEIKPIKSYKFPIGRIVILISENPEYADIDHSNKLNVTEAILLGTALGIDNITATIAASLNSNITFLIPLIMCIIQTSLLYSGILSAKKLCSPSIKKQLNYFPGIILITIGILRFF